MPELASVTGSPARVEERPEAEVVRAVRRFVDQLPEAVSRDRAGALPPELLESARELGLFGLAIPEVHGGLGFGLGQVASVVAELARVDRSLATMIGLHNGLGTRALIEADAPALAARYLPELASGARISAFAATEPGAGSDLTAIQTTARHDGASLRLAGEKAYVTNAGLAGLFTVLARTPETGGTALVIVEREARGLSLGAEEHKMGLRASSTRSLFLDDARAPIESQLSSAGRGIEEAHRALEWGRTLMSAGCLGTARAALSRSLSHATHRRQFRRSLSAFGAVKAHLASIATSVVTIDAVLATVVADEARGAPIDASSAALKVLASELAFDAADRAVQVHGALGFVEDDGVAILQRDARVTRIFEGANDVLLLRLGSALLAGHGLSGKRDQLPDLENAWTRFDALVEITRRWFGVRAVSHQRLVLSLARADVLLFAAEACLSVAERSTPIAAKEAAHRLTIDAVRMIDDARRATTDESCDVAVLDSLGEDALALVRPD